LSKTQVTGGQRCEIAGRIQARHHNGARINIDRPRAATKNFVYIVVDDRLAIQPFKVECRARDCCCRGRCAKDITKSQDLSALACDDRSCRGSRCRWGCGRGWSAAASDGSAYLCRRTGQIQGACNASAKQTFLTGLRKHITNILSGNVFKSLDAANNRKTGARSLASLCCGFTDY
jgi:hypothetical protein